MINIKSYIILTKARITFVKLSPFYTESPPLANEKIAPVRSRKVFEIFHPFVLFLLKL